MQSSYKEVDVFARVNRAPSNTKVPTTTRLRRWCGDVFTSLFRALLLLETTNRKTDKVNRLAAVYDNAKQIAKEINEGPTWMFMYLTTVFIPHFCLFSASFALSQTLGIIDPWLPGLASAVWFLSSVGLLFAVCLVSKVILDDQYPGEYGDVLFMSHMILTVLVIITLYAMTAFVTPLVAVVVCEGATLLHLVIIALVASWLM
jgi:hypothetical protein